MPRTEKKNCLSVEGLSMFDSGILLVKRDYLIMSLCPQQGCEPKLLKVRRVIMHVLSSYVFEMPSGQLQERNEGLLCHYVIRYIKDSFFSSAAGQTITINSDSLSLSV